MKRERENYLRAFLPNPAQELLLKAALAEGDEAVVSWREYLKRVAFDDTDYGSSRILPMVYKNLHRLGFEDPYLGRMKGIYRRTWAENQKNFRHLPGVFSALREAGIPALLLKGSALLLLCYHDFGLRGMGDFDVAVPVGKVREAAAILERMQWRLCLEYPKLQVELHHAVHMQNPMGEDLDLHWHILGHRCAEEYDRPFWEASRPLRYRGAEFPSLQPSDHLLHVCLHGAAWSAMSPLRWVADAFYIAKHCEIDWARVLKMGEYLGAIPALQATLPYLKARFSVAIPEDFISGLTALKVPDWQRRELRALCRPRGFFGILPLLWSLHSLQGRMVEGMNRYSSFPNYLKTFYGLESYGALGRYFFRKTWKKIRPRRRAQAALG